MLESPVRPHHHNAEPKVALEALLHHEGPSAKFFETIFTPTALLLLWSVFRARKELGQVFAGMHRIDRDSSLSEQEP